MSILIILLNILLVGLLFPQLVTHVQSFKNKTKYQSIDVLRFFTSLFLVWFNIYLMQTMGGDTLNFFIKWGEKVESINIFLVVFFCLILLIIALIIESNAIKVLVRIKNRNSVFKNILSFIILSFFLGVILFIIILLNHKFLPPF